MGASVSLANIVFESEDPALKADKSRIKGSQPMLIFDCRESVQRLSCSIQLCEGTLNKHVPRREDKMRGQILQTHVRNTLMIKISESLSHALQLLENPFLFYM